MGECSAYSSLYRRTQRSSLQLGLWVGGHIPLTDFGPEEPQWTLAYGWRRRWQHYKYRRGYYYYYCHQLSCVYSDVVTRGHTSDVMFRVIVSVLTVAQDDCRLIEIGNVAQATGGHVCHSSSFALLMFHVFFNSQLKHRKGNGQGNRIP